MELLLHNKSSRSSRQQLLLVILRIQSGGNPLWRRMFYAINLILGGGTGHVPHSLYISPGRLCCGTISRKIFTE